MKTTPHLLGTIALLLGGFGVLLFMEVIRPFRDMSIDGPIALGSWGTGLALGITCFFLKGRSLTLTIISVAANLLLLLAALALLWAISNSNFAWH